MTWPFSFSPWLLLIAIGGTVGGWGLGHWQGHASASDACEADKNVARGLAMARWTDELTDATEASLANQGVAIELNTTLHVGRDRSRVIVREVSNDVDAHPDLAGCLVPDNTRRLRDEQVADSARIAAEDRPVQ